MRRNIGSFNSGNGPGTQTRSLSAAAYTAGSNEDEAAIRKVIAEMTDGFNNHDNKAAPAPRLDTLTY